MGDVSFDEYKPEPAYRGKAKLSFFERLAMRIGFGKTKAQADVFLVVISLLLIVASFFVFTSNSSTSSQNVTLYREDIPEDVLRDLSPEILRAIPSRNQ